MRGLVEYQQSSLATRAGLVEEFSKILLEGTKLGNSRFPLGMVKSQSGAVQLSSISTAARLPTFLLAIGSFRWLFDQFGADRHGV